MKIAIMQPYVFPYIGYFQLINTVDTFVIYDDVAFIKQGWINRNNILVQGKKKLFTIPLEHQSSFRDINETKVNPDLIHRWKIKFYKTIEYNYKKAPYYKETEKVIKEVLNSDYSKITDYCTKSISVICDFLSINTKIIDTSAVYKNQQLKGQERIWDICNKENADTYVNSFGGIDIYSKDKFVENGIELLFIKSKPITYRQFNNEFIPSLSIIDLLMFNSQSEINRMLNEFELL